MGSSVAPNCVEDGLVFCLDAANKKSVDYPTGTFMSGKTVSTLETKSYPAYTYTASTTGYITYYDDNKGVLYFSGGTAANLKNVTRVRIYPVINLGSGNTIDAWVKMTSYANSQPWVGGNGVCGGASPTCTGEMNITASRVYGIQYNSLDVSCPVSVPLNTWTNVTTVRNGDNWRVYVNGVSICNDQATGWGSNEFIVYAIGQVCNSTTPSSPPTSCGIQNGLIYTPNGALASLKFYNRPLTANEIYQNYRVLKPRFGYYS